MSIRCFLNWFLFFVEVVFHCTVGVDGRDNCTDECPVEYYATDEESDDGFLPIVYKHQCNKCVVFLRFMLSVDQQEILENL